jgi:hypothetical protein
MAAGREHEVKRALWLVAFLFVRPASAEDTQTFATPGLARCAREDSIDLARVIIAQSALGSNEDTAKQLAENVSVDVDRLILLAHDTTLDKVTCRAPITIDARPLVEFLTTNGDAERANWLNRRISKDGTVNGIAIYTVEPTAKAGGYLVMVLNSSQNIPGYSGASDEERPRKPVHRRRITLGTILRALRW